MDACVFTARHIVPRVQVTRLTGVPRSLDGVRLLFVTDIHMRASMDAEALVEQMRSCRADCVLFGGDLADRRDQAERLLKALAALKPPLGMYACLGNNDPEAFPDREAFRAALSEIGCTLLVNQAVRVGEMTIAGVDEYKYGKPDPRGLFHADDAFRVLLSHYPVYYPLPEEERPQLELCGHTHGGQFSFLGITPYSIGFERCKLKREGVRVHHVAGWRDENGTRMLVSKGIGMSRIPLRVGVRSEMHVIELMAGDAR